MVEAGATHAVLEVTSHGLAQHRVAGCDFDVAAVTNITHEHLDFHGSLEAYQQAKARLFEGLTRSFRKPGRRLFPLPEPHPCEPFRAGWSASRPGRTF
ncbi:MAG: UDP-N-acetylmuramoyl-L-alanyl-D-glutamate--2,6-diaminopimelate ligase, partial [Chloroflexi bacterium]|nr:UDP-N-acetylmuramoyl-L-alanyl-D-glutamate--2,6-diaminopimelate ligase [Chloroflexota bacterium]